MKQVRNYLAMCVAACIGARVASWLVQPFVVPLVAALIIATAAELVLKPSPVITHKKSARADHHFRWIA